MAKSGMTMNVKKRVKTEKVGEEEQTIIPEVAAADVENFMADSVTSRQKQDPKQKPDSKIKTKAQERKKVVRDSFSCPEDDYALIEKLRTRYAKAGIIFNKAEVLRAGLHALNQMKAPELKQTQQYIKKVKVGRPTK